MPKVSVHIVTMNNARFLPCVIRSLAAESYKDFETQIFEGPSKDGSAELIEREFAKYPHLKYRMTVAESHVGMADARQRLLEACDSDYFLVLDGDDVMVPGNIAYRVEELDATPELAGIYGELCPIDEKGVSLSKVFGLPFSRFLLPSENRVLHPTHIVRLSDALAAGGYREMPGSAAEDYSLWMRIAPKKDFRLSERTTGLYRLHSSQATKAKEIECKNIHKMVSRDFLASHSELQTRLLGGGRLAPEELGAATMILGILCATESPDPRLLELAMELAPDDYGVHCKLIGSLMQREELGQALTCAERFERRFSMSPRIRMEAVACKARILSGMVGELARVPASSFDLGVP